MISLSDDSDESDWECDWESDVAVQRCLEESLNKEITNEGYINTVMDICVKGLIENNTL